MTIIIEKGVPIQHKRAYSRRYREYKYPFPGMEVGDSFAVPRNGKKYGPLDAVQSILSATARNYAKRHNPTAKFTVRIVDENTVRCWRIA